MDCGRKKERGGGLQSTGSMAAYAGCGIKASNNGGFGMDKVSRKHKLGPVHGSDAHQSPEQPPIGSGRITAGS